MSDSSVETSSCMNNINNLAPAYKVKIMKRASNNIYVIQATRCRRMVWRTNWNIVIIRSHSEELTLINAVRLNTEGKELLQSLGYVARVIQLGCNLGAAHDFHYKTMHRAHIWAPTAISTPNYHVDPTYVDHIITKNTVLPFAKSKVFLFRSDLVKPEAAMLIGLSSTANNNNNSNYNNNSYYYNNNNNNFNYNNGYNYNNNKNYNNNPNNNNHYYTI